MPVEIEPEETPRPADVDELLDRAWSQRKLPEQLSTLESRLDAYTQTAARNTAIIEELLKPLVLRTSADQQTVERAVTTLTSQFESFIEHQWPTLVRLVEDLGERLQRVERKQDEFAHAIVQHDSRLSRVESALVAQDGRIKALELIRVEQTGASRERKHWITVAKAAVVAAAGAIGWLANHLF